MRNFILAAALQLLAFSSAAGESNILQVDQTQQQLLGIQTQPLQHVDIAWGAMHPATVQVPNDQLRVVRSYLL